MIVAACIVGLIYGLIACGLVAYIAWAEGGLTWQGVSLGVLWPYYLMRLARDVSGK